MADPLILLVRLAGFEPAICGLEALSLIVAKSKTVKDFRHLVYFEIAELC